MPMVHVLHREYDGSLRMMIFDGADPATLIRIVVKLVLPLKLQFIMSFMFPISLALAFPTSFASLLSQTVGYLLFMRPLSFAAGAFRPIPEVTDFVSHMACR